MERNVCGIDRIARTVLGIFLLGVLLRSSRRQEATDWSISRLELLTVYAIAELSVNVFAQFCPLNAALGINTCRRN